MDCYKQIFKRKSFHLFGKTETITKAEIEALENFIKSAKSLNEDIKVNIRIVPEGETTCKRGGQYCMH